MFDNVRADFRAHGRQWGAQGFWAMTVYRFGRWRYTIRWGLVRKPMSLLYHLLYKWIQIVAGIELPCEVDVGPNFVIDHFGGIVVSGYARFGADCRIRNGVVVGLARVDQPTAPWIGDRVDIGANAVVVRDVPDGHVAVGVPAVNKPRSRAPS